LAHSVDLLFPERRMVFAVGAGTAELQPELDSPEGFARYKEIQRSGEAAAMLVIPNACLIKAAKNYVVDPGIPMQGAPYSSAIGNLGVDPWGLKDVILTHMHFDHVGGLMEFPGRRVYVHETELEAPYAGMWSGLMDTVEVVRLSGQEGEFEPGVRWMLTPGHADGLITLLVDTDDGLVAIPSDCVGPLPEYFDNMDLPQDFPEREILLEQWKKIRDLSPVLVIPGHYPPFTP
jgi:glyoxylase-like metal-dependent hydrolase (beta-lactamase superfamily II)